jgi:hypothetical protein
MEFSIQHCNGGAYSLKKQSRLRSFNKEEDGATNIKG